MTILKLQSCDGVVFVVDLEIANCSTTIKTMIDDLGMEDGDEEVPIPLPVVHANILDKIIQWAVHHKNEPPLEESDPNLLQMTKNLCAWDVEFFKMDDQMFYKVLEAANYLNIKPLLESACKIVASRIEGMTPEQFREKFGVQYDLTPEEERKIRKFEY